MFLAVGSNFSCTFGCGVEFLLCFSPRGHISCLCLAAESNFSCTFGRGVTFLVCVWPRGQISRVFLDAGPNFLVYFWPRSRIDLVCFAAGPNVSFIFGRGVKFLVYVWPRGRLYLVFFAAGSKFSCTNDHGSNSSRVFCRGVTFLVCVFGRGVKFLVCFWTRGQIYRVFWPRGQLSRVFWPRDQFSCVFFGRGVKCLVCALAAGSIFACMFGRGVKFPKKIIASDLGPRSKLCESVVGAAKSRPRDPKRAQESPKHANTRTPGRAFFSFFWAGKGGPKKCLFLGPRGPIFLGRGRGGPEKAGREQVPKQRTQKHKKTVWGGDLKHQEKRRRLGAKHIHLRHISNPPGPPLESFSCPPDPP